MTRYARLLLILTCSRLLLPGSDDIRPKQLYYFNSDKPTTRDVRVPDSVTKHGSTKSPTIRTPTPGLKCWIDFRRHREEQWTPAPLSREFQAGDHIRLHIESNVAGQLTVVQRQDSNPPELLFPAPDHVDDAAIVPRQERVIGFAFDSHPGLIYLVVMLHPATAHPFDSSNTSAGALFAAGTDLARGKGLQREVDDTSDGALYVVSSRPSSQFGSSVAAELFLKHITTAH
jgi:hypothetical protein